MLSGLESPLHLLILLVIAILVLGLLKPKRLPELGRSLGSGIRHFRSSISGEDEEEELSSEKPALPKAEAAPSGRAASEKAKSGLQ